MYFKCNHQHCTGHWSQCKLKYTSASHLIKKNTRVGIISPEIDVDQMTIGHIRKDLTASTALS